jgi:putative membrane protein
MKQPAINRVFLLSALAFFAAVWIALALHPVDRRDWLLENLLVFISAGVLSVTYRRFHFSNVSYALILAFLLLHTIGAHYTYAKVPAGFWMADWFHLDRNHYDRVIHFGFGFLLLFPMSEVMRRSAEAHPRWAIWLALVSLCALSSLFEIIEATVAQFVAPDLGAAYLGTQGDMWDAQKDMAAAFIGALATSLFLALRSALRRRL